MTSFLVFQLYGPMSSWGDIAVGEYRPTANCPSKSAVFGLLAAALGIRRHDDDAHKALQQGYGFATCVLEPGELLRDYHTVQVPRGRNQYAARRDELVFDRQLLGTILSRRDYRMDSYALAMFWPREGAPFSLDHLQQKLCKPFFVLYLGRKACPLALPLNPKIMESETLQEAFSQYPIDCSVLQSGDNVHGETVRYFWEQDKANQPQAGIQAVMTYPRRDQVISRRRWQFANRDEYTGQGIFKEDV